MALDQATADQQLTTQVTNASECSDRTESPVVRAAQFRRAKKRGPTLDCYRRTDPCRARAPWVDAGRVGDGGEASQERRRLLGTSSDHPNRALSRAPRLPAHSYRLCSWPALRSSWLPHRAFVWGAGAQLRRCTRGRARARHGVLVTNEPNDPARAARRSGPATLGQRFVPSEPPGQRRGAHGTRLNMPAEEPRRGVKSKCGARTRSGSSLQAESTGQSSLPQSRRTSTGPRTEAGRRAHL